MSSIARTSIVVYSGLITLSLIIAWRTDEPIALAAPGLSGVAVAIAAGLATGAGVVFLSRLWMARSPRGRDLALALGDLFGSLARRDVAIIALFSGVAEEMLFRGVIQPHLGYIGTSIVFGLVHIGPGRRYALWTVFALAAGFLMGALAIATGGVLAPAIAHVIVNWRNITEIGRLVDSGG